MFVTISVANSFPFPSSTGIGPTYAWEQSVQNTLKSYAVMPIETIYNVEANCDTKCKV